MNLSATPRKSYAASQPLTVSSTLPVLPKDITSNYIYLTPRVQDQNSGAVLHLDHVASQYRRAVIVGDAGTGKTSALYFLANGVPILSLSDYHYLTPPRQFENPARIILDDITDLSIHADYLSQLARGFSNAHIFVATRDATNFPPEFARLVLQPFSEREMASAVTAWSPNRAKELTAALKSNSATRQLATQPLDLFLLLQVYADANSLPTRRTELFNAYIHTHLQSGPDPDFAERVLEGIALALKRGQSAKEEHLVQNCGLLRTHLSGRVEFVHELVQDYFVARALRRDPDLALLREHLTEVNWGAVVLFYAGLGNPRPLIEALLEEGQIELAAHALGQAAELPDNLHKRIAESLIQRAWTQEDAAALAGLRALQSNLATDFFAARLKERDPATRARAARMLGQIRTDRAVEALVTQLRDVNADVRKEVFAALGQSRNSRVVEPLLVALRGEAGAGNSDTRTRVAAARALGEIGTERAVPALLVELQVGEPEVRAEAAQALAKIRSEIARAPLRALANDSSAEVRAMAEQVLKEM